MRSGIDLGEAQGNVRLSGNDLYTFHDLHTDDRRRIHLVVQVGSICLICNYLSTDPMVEQWGGYQPLTYEIPLDGYDGLVDLQALARRTARAVIHYLQVQLAHVALDGTFLKSFPLGKFSPHTLESSRASSSRRGLLWQMAACPQCTLNILHQHTSNMSNLSPQAPV